MHELAGTPLAGKPAVADCSAVIVDAIRTPIGSLGGALAAVRPDDLAALVLRTLIDRNRLDASQIDEVYLGCANQAGEDNRNVARMALLLAGIPVEVPGLTFNRLCASGMAAVNAAARAIRTGDGKPVPGRRGRKHEPRPLFASQSRTALCLWQPDCLGYRIGMALSKSAHARNGWNRIHGGNG